MEEVVEEPFRHSHGSHGKRHLAQHMRGPVVSESGLSEDLEEETLPTEEPAERGSTERQRSQQASQGQGEVWG